MIAFEDCFVFCDIIQRKIAATAEHEHVPERNAA